MLIAVLSTDQSEDGMVRGWKLTLLLLIILPSPERKKKWNEIAVLF